MNELAGWSGCAPTALETGLDRIFSFDQQYYLADDILVKSDRMSMAHSVEVRPPFLDHRIIEFAATLPPDLKIRGCEAEVPAERSRCAASCRKRC